jgi:hypothetical protein
MQAILLGICGVRADAIASRLAPTGFGDFIVGASLLAMAA